MDSLDKLRVVQTLDPDEQRLAIAMDNLEHLRYPVGRMPRNSAPLDVRTREEYLGILEAMPARVRSLVSGLSDAQLDTPYRPGGWTVRQVVHHVPDSHMNAYVRMKLGVTEDKPTVKTYEEARWAELPEAKSAPVAMSIDLLDALHRRWVAFLRALPEPDFRKAFSHPDWGIVSIEEALGMYAWHCRHHTEHIRIGAGK
jgi:DinB family protein